MVFYPFFFVGAPAQVSFFLPNFDAIRTKEAEMELVPIGCFGRGETEFLEFFESFTVVDFLRVLRSFSSLSFYS